jgi:hypothetical protein
LSIKNQKTMKRFLTAVLGLAFLSAQAQTADEVITKYSAAMGGLDAFNNVKSAKMTGIATLQGMDLPITIQVINGRAFRIDVEVMGQSVVNSYKDGKGWKINPFGGAETATDVEGAELLEYKAQASLSNSLMDYKARGHQIELLGQEDVDGKKAFKIKLTSKDDGKITTFFINSEDNMLLKSVSSREMQGQTVDVDTYYTDFKEFGGIKIAMTRTQKIMGQDFQTITLNNVELNVQVDEKSFDK